MYIDVPSPQDLSRLSSPAAAQWLSTRPSLVVVKASWCPHCIALEEPLRRARLALEKAKTEMNMVLLELEPYKHARRACAGNELIETLHAKDVARRGVPYIGFYIPPAPKARRDDDDEEDDLVPYERGPRTASSLLKFVEGTLERRLGRA